MPTYKYIAINESGKKVNGILSSESERAARQQIKASNLTPLSLGKTNRNHFLKVRVSQKKLLFAKEYKLINSRSYDSIVEKKYSISEKYITHLNAEMNGRHEIETRGYLPKNIVERHYFHLRKFLLLDAIILTLKIAPILALTDS